MHVVYCLGCGQAHRIAFMAAADYQGQLAELERGTLALGEAIEVGLEKAPELALEAARFAGSWYTGIEMWELAAMAYAQGLDAADLLVRVQLRRAYKENWLKTIGNLPSDAAYASAQMGEVRAAVLDVERGRGVLLAEALGLRDAAVERLCADGHRRLHARFNALVAKWNDLSAAHGQGSA